jgi:disulfide oxidoreductase YuzD
MNEVKFVVYGKEGCGYCEQRIEFLSKFIKLNVGLASFKIDYKSIEDPESLVDIVMLDGINQEEIPIVVMYINGSIEKIWQGFGEENIPTTRKILTILEGVSKDEK